MGAEETLTSPNGKCVFTFGQTNGKMTYSFQYDGKAVAYGSLGVNVDNSLVESAMGIPNDTSCVWTDGMTLTGVERKDSDATWKPLYGEYAAIRDHYNEMTLHFIKGKVSPALQGGTSYDKRKQYLFDIIVRAYDEGVAIRYHFPEATNGLFMHITDDLTTFGFAPGAEAYHAAWAQAQYNKVKLIKSKEKRAGSKENSLKDEEVWKKEAERPLTLHLANGLWAAIGEAALYDFVRGKLKLVADNKLQMSMFDTADVITPYDMPWRYIMVGERAVDLINNKQIVLNLNAPCESREERVERKENTVANKGKGLSDKSLYSLPSTLSSNKDWIRPGKAIRVTKLDMKSALQCVDFAADRGLQYIELDAGWYGPEMKMSSSALKVADNRDINMPKLCQYAKGKDIGVWLYVNQRALYQQLDSILPLYQQWGVSGIKFGFVQVGSQEWTTWLHKAVEKCARHHLMVDIHDEYRPTGWSRTFPNLMTQEGVGGNEEMPDARHNTILPFTRFLCGPADYTPCYFNGRVKNTHAHQLAMPVVYYSPITFLYWYDNPSLYRGEQELEFWKECPTVWDESIALDGEPGEYIVQARRSGDSWFVGVMNGMDARTVTVNTESFLKKGKKYVADIYTDDPSLKTRTNVATRHINIRGGEKLPLKLLPSGGAALKISEK